MATRASVISVVAAIVALAGCSGGGSAPVDADIADADWLAVDLAARTIQPLLAPPADLAGGARWRSSHILFRRLSAGAAARGRPVSDGVTEADERPRQAGVVPQVWFGVFELTRAQWLLLGGDADWLEAEPAFPDAGSGAPAAGMAPAEASSRLAAVALAGGWRLGLPTAWEWERACLAGSGTKFSWGDNLGAGAGPDPALQARCLGAGDGPAIVGSLQGNAWGLYDMHGNVWELAQGDLGWEARGGAWYQPVVQARASNRMAIPADRGTYAVGIRPVLRR